MSTAVSTIQAAAPPSWKRERHDHPSSAYVLPADEEEHERLLFLYKLTDKMFGGPVLDNSIQLEPGQTVLESGVAAGLWMLELASRLPSSVSFHGIDISDRLFPPNPPPNVTFSKNSILSLPQAWDGKFDLINQRLLVVALRGPEWRQAIAGMFKALKPDGHVQLVEIGQGTIVGPATEKLWGLLNGVFEKRGLSMHCANNIPGWLEEAGFVDINVDRRFIKHGATAGEEGVAWLKSYMHFMRACKPVIYEEEGLNWKGSDRDQEYEEMLASANQEWDESPDSTLHWFRFTARKPSK